MRWPRSHRDERAIEIQDDLARWRSDFEEPLPPVTRNELLDRLGLEVEDAKPVRATSSLMSDAEAVAAA